MTDHRRMGPHPGVNCRECGEVGANADYVPERRDEMLARRLCFTCNFWTTYLAQKAKSRRHVVISGVAYSFGEEPPAEDRGSWGLGFGGRRCVVERFTGERVESHNMWCRGVVPQLFRDRLPDDSRWVSGA